MQVSALGDSLTYGFGVVEENKWINRIEVNNLKFINHGVNGDTTFSMLFRFEEILKDKSDYIFIMGGINDFFVGYNAEDVYINMIKIIEKARQNLIEPIVGISMEPDFACVEEGWSTIITLKSVILKLKEYRAKIISYCQEEGIKYIDLYEEFPKEIDKSYQKYFLDGIHPTGEGHKIMAKIIYKHFSAYSNEISQRF